MRTLSPAPCLLVPTPLPPTQNYCELVSAFQPVPWPSPPHAGPPTSPHPTLSQPMDTQFALLQLWAQQQQEQQRLEQEREWREQEGGAEEGAGVGGVIPPPAPAALLAPMGHAANPCDVALPWLLLSVLQVRCAWLHASGYVISCQHPRNVQ